MVVGMMVGHCQSHPHHHHHHQNGHRGGSDSSREEQYGGNSSSSTNGSSSEYSLAMSSEVGDRTRHISTASLLDSIERRTQRTYRYGIGLVCVGATLNWLGFAQGTTYIDPLRYLGVACVLTGSFCVCLAMCRWLGRPITVSGHHVANLEEERSNGDVHVINVAVPIYVPSLHEEYRPTKPPDYEQIVAGEIPPPYDEAIKLSPGAFFGPSTNGSDGVHHLFASHFTTSSPCMAAPSHHNAASDLTRALLLDSDHQDNDNGTCDDTIISHIPPPICHLPTTHISFLRTNQDVTGESDPPPAYEPSPRPSISSCSSTPLIPTSTSRFDLPPSFSARQLFGIVSSNSPPQNSPRTGNDDLVSINEHLHEVICEDSNQTLVNVLHLIDPNGNSVIA